MCVSVFVGYFGVGNSVSEFEWQFHGFIIRYFSDHFLTYIVESCIPSLSTLTHISIQTLIFSLFPSLPLLSQYTAATAGATLPLIDDMDLSIQCDPKFLRSTIGKIVSSQAAATNTRLPLGLVCKPMAGDVGIDNDGE